MKQFEYQVQSYPMDRKTSLSTMQDELNALGREGWEVVSIIASEFAHVGNTAFLKRVLDAGHGSQDGAS